MLITFRFLVNFLYVIFHKFSILQRARPRAVTFGIYTRVDKIIKNTVGVIRKNFEMTKQKKIFLF